MDVPYLTSGALNRAHYALVQKVEGASSIQAADNAIFEQVESIRQSVAKKAPSPAHAREHLVILLYCTTAIESSLPLNRLAFALPLAVTLAENGVSLAQRRIGYLFCATVMPKDHELQLMLVNTLRKDLESAHPSRMCMALDMLVHSPTLDVIPAIQSRLEDLLAHNSPQVRRRTLIAFRALSALDTGLLERCLDKAQRRLQDEELYVVNAALSLYRSLFQAVLVNAEQVLNAGIQVLARSLMGGSGVKEDGWLQIKALATIQLGTGEGAPEASEKHALEVVIEVLNQSARNHVAGHAVLLESFRTLSGFPTALLTALPKNPVHAIRPLLNSTDPNIQFVALTCLVHVDASLWAGTTEEIPAILTEGEVNTIMGLLHSEERLIRLNTISILSHADPGILSAYLNHLLSTLADLSNGPIFEREKLASRSLEVSGTLYGADGAAYADRIREIISTVEDQNFVAQRNGSSSAKGKDPASSVASSYVMESPVDLVLTHIRMTNPEFQTKFTTQIVKTLTSDVVCTSTFVLIVAAIACEYSGLVEDAPQTEILHALSSRLKSSSPAIQEALLLSMLRVSARCEEVEDDIIDFVRELAGQSGRHIRSRCEQFCKLASQPLELKQLIARARSSNLPDFLQAIEYRPSEPLLSPTIRRSALKSPSPRSSSKSSIYSPSSSRRDLFSIPSPKTSPTKLRYDAYDAPQPAPKQTRPVRAQSSTRSSSSHSISATSPSMRPASSVVHLEDPFAFNGVPPESKDPLSRTVTAGDLSLVVGNAGFGSFSKDSVKPRTPLRSPKTRVESLVSKMDLINLDSPFHNDVVDFDEFQSARPQSLTEADDFEEQWTAAGSTSRGWCEDSPKVTAQHLERVGLEVKRMSSTRADGEIQIIVTERQPGGFLSKAAIRLRLGEDNSCLWLFKCEDPHLKARIKASLQGS